MTTLSMILRIVASLCCAAAAVAIWRAPAWLVWTLLIPGAVLAYEAHTIIAGGTLSGHVWWLRAHPGVGSLLGAAAVALVVWLVHHFWLEPDVLPHLRASYRDDGIIAAAALLLSLLTARLARRGQRGRS